MENLEAEINLVSRSYCRVGKIIAKTDSEETKLKPKIDSQKKN